MHAYDASLFRRSLAAIAILFSIAAGTVVATDEATSTTGMRAARLAALAPLIIAVALLGVAAQARARGELCAVESLGSTPWRALRGAERAGVLTAVASLVVLVAPWTDATSLLPAVHPAIAWRVAADGSHAVAPGLVALANGAIESAGAIAPPRAEASAAWAALPCIAPIACVVSAWATTPMPPVRRVSSSVATVAAAIVALHLVAAERVPPMTGMLAAVPLALSLYRSRRRG